MGVQRERATSGGRRGGRQKRPIAACKYSPPSTTLRGLRTKEPTAMNCVLSVAKGEPLVLKERCERIHSVDQLTLTLIRKVAL